MAVTATAKFHYFWQIMDADIVASASVLLVIQPIKQLLYMYGVFLENLLVFSYSCD